MVLGGKCCWVNKAFSLLPSLPCCPHGEEEEQEQSYHTAATGTNPFGVLNQEWWFKPCFGMSYSKDRQVTGDAFPSSVMNQGVRAVVLLRA